MSSATETYAMEDSQQTQAKAVTNQAPPNLINHQPPPSDGFSFVTPNNGNNDTYFVTHPMNNGGNNSALVNTTTTPNYGSNISAFVTTTTTPNYGSNISAFVTTTTTPNYGIQGTGVVAGPSASYPNARFEFPPGYRFEPKDEELIVHYLVRKVRKEPLPWNRIHDVKLYSANPDTLAKIYEPAGEKQWYFFTPRDRKYRNGSRPNRAAGDGYWKATGADKIIMCNGQKVGFRKALVFYMGKPPKGDKTSWIMHEYRVETPSTKNKREPGNMLLDEWVLCRIYRKSDKSSSGLRHLPTDDFDEDSQALDEDDSYDNIQALPINDPGAEIADFVDYNAPDIANKLEYMDFASFQFPDVAQSQPFLSDHHQAIPSSYSLYQYQEKQQEIHLPNFHALMEQEEKVLIAPKLDQA